MGGESREKPTAVCDSGMGCRDREGTGCPQGSEVTGSSVGFVEEREVGAQGASRVVQC